MAGKDYTVTVGGKKYAFTASEGMSEEDQRKVVEQHTGPAASQDQTLRFDGSGKQINQAATWDPHRGEQGYLPMLGRAAMALPGSAYRAGEQLVSTIANAGQVYEAVKKLGFSGVVEAIGDDLVEHYGSLEKARRTFETDPFRFLLDISAVGTVGGGLLAKLPGVAGRIGEAAVTAGRAVDPVLVAGKAAKVVSEPAARVLGRTTGTGAQTMREAAEAGAKGTPLPAGAQPIIPRGVRNIPLGGAVTLDVLDRAFGGLPAHLASAHPFLTGAVGVPLAAATSPRAAGSFMYGLGAAPRATERVAPYARAASAALPGREEAKTNQTYTVTAGGKKYQFEAPEGLSEEQQQQLVQQQLGQAPRTQVTVNPEQGGYNAALR